MYVYIFMLLCFEWYNTFNQGELIEYKEGAIGFSYTLLWRFWTAKELIFA